MHNIFSMLCFIISRKVKMQLKCKKKICAVYGEAAVTDRMCQKWFAKFHAGDFSQTMLHSRVGQLQLVAIKSRH